MQQDVERGNDASGSVRGAGNLVGAGLAAGGVAALVWWLLKGQKKLGGEDSPILIKGGSLTVGVHRDDAEKAALEIPSLPSFFYKLKSPRLENKKKWDVTVFQLDFGFPVGDPILFGDVDSVHLEIINDKGDRVDGIKMTYEPANSALRLSSDDDRQFSKTVKPRKVKRSKHPFRAFHRSINDKDEFDIGKITVKLKTGEADPLPAGPGYVLAFDFV